jgi:hypothetical protein
MNADHVYSHHDDRGDQDDVGENDEGLDVEELMQNVASDVLLQCRNKGFDNFETLNKPSRGLLYEECKGCYKKHMVLWMILELLKLKASNRWLEYNQCDEVPFFVDTRRINIVETKISYSNMILYACTDGEGKLVHV